MLIPFLLLFRQSLNCIATRWQTLIKVAANPYRPELHYIAASRRVP